MKRYISLIISLCLILGSFSFVFASATQWDTSDQANLLGILRAVTSYGTGNLFYKVSHIDSTLDTISTNINTIKGYLTDSGHSVAYYLSGIDSWMNPIYSAITQTPTDLATIIGSLGYYTNNGTTYNPYLNLINNTLNNTYGSTFSLTTFNNNTDTTNWTTFNYVTSGSVFNQILQSLRFTNNNNMGYYVKSLNAQFGNYNLSRQGIDWNNLSTFSHVASSQSEGQNFWLSMIQQPVARLSYVLASDERLAAQQAASAAEQQVVNDFIDPNGDSSATATDFGSISDLSSGYQQNFGSTASISGIFNIFDSNNFGWFSSETYQQLDTTVAQRGSSFETPLLDQQLEDISRALGVDYAN